MPQTEGERSRKGATTRQSQVPAPDRPPARQASLIVNARSRSGERAFARARELLVGNGVPVRHAYAVHDPVRIPEIVQEVLNTGHDLIILGGGDGTVSSVVDFLAGTDVVLGLLPLGTANDFARTLHLPFDLEEACRCVAGGKVVDVDLGLVGDNHYVNVASVGMGPLVTQALSPTLKKRLGALAYPIAALKGVTRHRPFSARLSFPDGEREPQELDGLFQIGVGNGRFYGGGLVVAPESSVDDRTLDVYAVRLKRWGDLPRLVRHIKGGDLSNVPGAFQYRTTRVLVETRPQLPINVDGELVATTPQVFSVARNALHVRVPQASTAAKLDT